MSGSGSDESSGEQVPHLASLSDDSVFRCDSDSTQAEAHVDMGTDQTSEERQEEPSTSGIKPSFSYEVLSAKTGPWESDV